MARWAKKEFTRSDMERSEHSIHTAVAAVFVDLPPADQAHLVLASL
jgi:hypothetical protein